MQPQKEKAKQTKKPLILFLFPLVLALIVNTVYGFSVSDVPSSIENGLGITGSNGFIGGLIASLILLCLVLFPTMILTKGKAYSLYILLSLAVLAPLVGLGWFPVYVYIIIVLLIALKFGKEMADFLGGLRR